MSREKQKFFIVKSLVFAAVIVAVSAEAYVPAAFAAAGTSADYTLDSSSVSSGGGTASSASYNLTESSVGGNFTGTVSSADYRICSEFVEETGSNCVAAAPVTPPVIPPVTPPAAGGGGGSGYMPPKTTTVQPVVKPPATPPATLPVTPPVKPPVTNPAAPQTQEQAQGITQQPVVSPAPSLPGVSPPSGEEKPIAVAQPVPGLPGTWINRQPGVQGTWVNRPSGVAGQWTNQQPGGPSGNISPTQETVWCGTTACAGIPGTQVHPSAMPVTRPLISISWEWWFLLSLVITAILFWVEWKIDRESAGRTVMRHARRGAPRRFRIPRRGRKKK